MTETPTAIEWLSWGEPAFARAVQEDRPILLALVAPWCEHCAVMDRITYANPDVARIVNSRFVAVKVNTDRRPDINERYNLGGWPTTVFLTPAGEILAGDTFFEADRMLSASSAVAEAFLERRAQIDARASMPSVTADQPVPTPDEDPVEWLSLRVLDQFDREQGGFGAGPKFPHVPALTLALERYRETGERRYAEVVATSLDALSALEDGIEGGFFRYASRRDWSHPHTEKLLQDNAELIGLHLEAGVVLERGEYVATAGRAIKWAQRVLADPHEGGFGVSQRADEAYYRLNSADARAAQSSPAVDPTQYSDSNAGMVAAYLFAAQALGEHTLRDFALQSLDRTMVAAYRPGAGVAHVSLPGADVWGLLADQVRVTDALMRAHAASGQLPYSMLAAELMEYALRTMWDEERGGFQDRARGQPQVECGLLRRPVRSFVVNCEAARMLYRLSLITGRADYLDRAQRTLASLGAAYRDEPLAGSAYGLALREVRDGHLPSGLSLSYVDWRLSESDDD